MSSLVKSFMRVALSRDGSPEAIEMLKLSMVTSSASRAAQLQADRGDYEGARKTLELAQKVVKETDRRLEL